MPINNNPIDKKYLEIYSFIDTQLGVSRITNACDAEDIPEVKRLSLELADDLRVLASLCDEYMILLEGET